MLCCGVVVEKNTYFPAIFVISVSVDIHYKKQAKYVVTSNKTTIIIEPVGANKRFNIQSNSSNFSHFSVYSLFAEAGGWKILKIQSNFSTIIGMALWISGAFTLHSLRSRNRVHHDASSTFAILLLHLKIVLSAKSQKQTSTVQIIFLIAKQYCIRSIRSTPSSNPCHLL